MYFVMYKAYSYVFVLQYSLMFKEESGMLIIVLTRWVPRQPQAVEAVPDVVNRMGSSVILLVS